MVPRSSHHSNQPTTTTTTTTSGQDRDSCVRGHCHQHCCGCLADSPRMQHQQPISLLQIKITFMESSSAAASEAVPDNENGDANGDTCMGTSLAGVKREYADVDNNDEESNPAKKINSSDGPTSDNAMTTNCTTEPSLDERDSTIAALRTSLSTAKEELDKWKNTFTNDSLLPWGVLADPSMVIQLLRKLQASESHLKEQLSTVISREGALRVKLATTEQEVVELKSAVCGLVRMTNPSKATTPSKQQPRRLLPKPATYEEYFHMKKELEPTEKRLKELQDNQLAVVQFTPHNKTSSNGICGTTQMSNPEVSLNGTGGKEDNEVRAICAPPIIPRKRGRPRKVIVKEDEDEGEEAKKNWMDSEIEAMIELRWEMEPEFVENAYKTGVDMWLKLQTRMVTSIPGFTRSSLACQRKFNSLIKQHKKDICAMRESGQAHYACKFFHSLDRWWRINGTVMKHVTGSGNSPNHHVSNSELPATNTKNEGAKKDTVVKEEDGGEEGKKNWVDSEVGTLIDLRWDMEPGLVQNVYKSAEDMWVKLQAQMSSTIPGFTRSSLACQRKFESLLKQHKDILAKEATGEDRHAYRFKFYDRHACKFYDKLNRWCQTAAITTSPKASESPPATKDKDDGAKKESVVKEDVEDGKKFWVDSEVELLIGLRTEMDSEFTQHIYKPGEDPWSKLQNRMSAAIEGFMRSSIACQRKFESLLKQHKDLRAKEEAGENSGTFAFYDRHACKFTENLNQFCNIGRTIVKHATASADDSHIPLDSLELANGLKEDQCIKEEDVVKGVEDGKRNWDIVKDDDDGEEGKKNWADSEVQTLIALRGEMDADFVKYWKKQGENMWSKVHNRMLLEYPGFTRSSLACKKKFNNLMKQYKEIRSKDLSAEARLGRGFKFYDCLDQWWQNNAKLVKHTSASTNESDLPVGTLVESTTTIKVKEDDGPKLEIEESCAPKSQRKQVQVKDVSNIYGTFSKMVENSTIMVNHFAKTSALLEKMDAHMDRLIDKL